MPSPDQHQVTTLLSQTTTWLSDAAAVADAAKDENSWWESYIQIYKNGLAFVHDNIVDEPLRKLGFDQTWGVSIFLFTAGWSWLSSANEMRATRIQRVTCTVSYCNNLYIILGTGVRALLVPFSIQQSKSSEYMKALKPYQQKIKEKYTDKNMQNRAISKLFEDAQANPLAGCVTSFAQIPIFLGLYRSVTRLAQEGRLDEPFLWIPSLQGPVTAETNYRGTEWLTQGWVDGVPPLSWETTLAFCVMPVLLVLGQSFTMNVPAGLTIYWFTSNLFTVSQSLIIRGYYAANPPEVKLPDYWGALDKGDELTADEKRAAAMAGLSTGPTFDQLMEEAKFHYVVKRDPIRENSEAWSRVQFSGSKAIPDEMKSWVDAKVEAPATVSS
eukprot:scaffold1657_cov182-Alexandrium_tamarense.AAC.29